MKFTTAIWRWVYLLLTRKRMRIKSASESRSPLKIGHRGAAGYCPENTFASFHKAMQLGVDYIEMDVQMTKDGQLVVIHDPTVNRTTNGKGKVRDFTLKEIQALDAGSWFDSKFSGEKIPSFYEFLDEFGGKVGILLEIKNPSLYPGIEKKIADELLHRGLTSAEGPQVIVQSFDQNSLKRFHQLIPSIQLGVLLKRFSGKGISNQELVSFLSFAAYVNPKITMVNKRLIRRIHQHGFKTLVWTIRKKNEVNFLMHFHIEGVISDYPDFLNH
ncbi:glycerophosphodiester phosphodiesterase [Neobacillus drentensis]|uniref:glycerophosphodiester phosphodiesterase n=1 Tax=Neobacillus drentensis TaxID=220684 RepID=UPI001F2EFA96|nr:glycerophosphodiester phosphodiesterase family protein [Neobacillus drentensis]ULT58368.1 glycerophosphodiester phosphodiesterase [Neobacillus drentensis]